MKSVFQKIILVISFCLLFASGTKAQENKTWIELFVTNDFVEALATANVLNFQFEEIGIIRSEETSYAVVSGPFDLTKAREQLELIYASPYGETLPLRLSDGSNYQNLVWLTGSPVEEETNLESILSSDESENRLTDLVGLEMDSLNRENILADEIVSGAGNLTSDQNLLIIELESLSEESGEQSELNAGVVEIENLDVPADGFNQEMASDNEVVPEGSSEKVLSTPTPLIEELEFSQINQKKHIQLALRVIGLYSGDVDGIFGSQSKAAASLYQRRHGEEETGSLTLEQRTKLYSEAEEVIGFAGSMMLTDRNLGLKVILPTSLLEIAEIKYPYVVLSPIGFRDINVVLISMDGGRKGIRALHTALLRHADIPEESNKLQHYDRFRISYSDLERNFSASARLFEDRIRGVIISWNPDQDSWMKEYSQIITGSIGEANKNIRFPFEEVEPLQNNLQILDQIRNQDPRLSSTGFFVSPAGEILTSYKNVENCAFITADFNQEVEIDRAFEEWDLALLKPVEKVSPLLFAELRDKPLSYESRIILSGYSFGGLVKEASIAVGSLSNLLNDGKRGTNYILNIQASESDFGGPIFDDTGSVIGVLTRLEPKGKILPSGTQIVQASETVLDLLTDSGMELVPSKRTEPLDLQQLSRIARDITVLIRCY